MAFSFGYSEIWGPHDPQGDQIDEDIKEAYGSGDILLAEYLNAKYKRNVQPPTPAVEDHLFSPSSALTDKNNPYRQKIVEQDARRADLNKRIRTLQAIRKVFVITGQACRKQRNNQTLRN